MFVFFFGFRYAPQKTSTFSYQDQKPLEAMYHLNEFQEAGFGSTVGRFFELFCGQRKHGSTCFLLTPWGSPLGGWILGDPSRGVVGTPRLCQKIVQHRIFSGAFQVTSQVFGFPGDNLNFTTPGVNSYKFCVTDWE